MGATAVGGHSIDALWKRCDLACADAQFASQWNALDRTQREFAYPLDRVDPGAATFRYPVDRQNQPWKRGQVDLAELEKSAAAFQNDLLLLVREATAVEPIPIAEEEAGEAAEELRSLVSRCRSLIRSNKEVADQFFQQMDAMRALTSKSSNRLPDPRRDGVPEFESIAEVTEPLASRAEDLLNRVVDTYGVELAPMPPLGPIDLAPRLNPFDSPAKNAEVQKAQIEWIVDRLVRQLRPLAKAVDAVCSRSEFWETPAAHQIHLDVTRLQSRLLRTRTS
jgi:hypothetical protein